MQPRHQLCDCNKEVTPHCAKKMNKENLQRALKAKDPKINLVKKNDAKSSVWNKFQLIQYNNESQDFVCCIECKTILAYTHKTGLGSLSRHKCVKQSKEPTSNQPSILQFSKKAVPDKVLDNLARKQLGLVAKDLHVLGVADGKLLSSSF